MAAETIKYNDIFGIRDAARMRQRWHVIPWLMAAWA